MRKRRTMRVAALAACVLAACEVASRDQGGDPDKQGDGQAPEQGQGTIANDTTPHRPGAPTPNDGTTPPAQP